VERPDLFVPLSVKCPRNPSIRGAGYLAELLFYRGLMYAKDNGTAGWIPAFDIQVVAVGMPDTTEALKALTDEELWVEGDGGWNIPSWDSWNRVGEEDAARAEKKRNDAARRKRNQREREKIAGGQVPAVPVVSVPEPLTDRPSVPPDVTRDVTRDGHAVTELEKEREIEKEPSLREGVQPPLVGVVEPATPPAPRRTKGEPKESKPNPHAVADQIVTDWYERNKTTSGQKFIAVQQIIRPLVARGVEPQLLAAAMDAATADGFAISGGSLTTAMKRLQRAQQPAADQFGNVTQLRPSPATRKAGAAFARAARYAAEEGEQLPADPFALEA
jgi:hypothetical protein